MSTQPEPGIRTPNFNQRPIGWIEEASPAEIAEAILAVDIGKAAAVAMYITDRIGAEIGEIATRFESQMNTNPAGTISKMLGGALRGFLRG